MDYDLSLVNVMVQDETYVLDASTSDTLDEDAYGPEYPDDAEAIAGLVDMVSDGVFVNTLGGRGDDTRVDVVVTPLRRPFSVTEQAATQEFNDTFVEFELDCRDTIEIMTLEGDHQGDVIKEPGRYQFQLYMRILDRPLRDGGPWEQHQLVFWRI